MRFLSLIFLLFFSFTSLAEIVKNIEINGLVSISRGTVLSYLPVEVGDEYSNELKNTILSNLEQTSFFSKVNISINDEKLIIDLIENPTIKYFEILNYKDGDVLSEKTVTDIQKNFDLQIGKIFAKGKLDKLVNQLVNLYQSNAYYKTKVKLKTETDDKNRIGISLVLEEGDRALISSFSFSGNKHFTSEDLIDLFDIGEPDFFLINYFTEKDSFSVLEFENGIERVKSKYLKNGFLDFIIRTTSVIYDDENNSIKIDIEVDEGKQYLLNEITFLNIDGIIDARENTLESYIDINKEDVFDRERVVKSINKITKFFQDQGYVNVVVNSKISKLQNKNYVNLNINIDLGLKFYIDRIEIEGNTTSQDDVIRRELKILEGQLYSSSDIEESIKRIKRLGYFSDVQYQIIKRKSSTDKVSLLITVNEAKTGQISVGLSHSNSTGASVTAGISQKNILGTGNTLNATISNSDAVKEASFYFSDPYFNNKKHKISYGAFNKKIDALNLDASAYSISDTGFSVGYGIPLDEFSNIFSELRFSTIDLTCGDDLLNTYEVNDCLANKDLDTSISLKYSNNSVNDFYFPSDGQNLSVSSILSFPVGDFKYFQISANLKDYTPIFNDKVFKFSTRLNMASGYGGDTLPFYKRFYEGGSSSVRGFDFNSLGEKYPNNKPKGGEFSFINSLSLSSKLDFLGIDNPNMRGILFTDLGMLSSSLEHTDFNDLRSSVGAKFSWLTPIGPLGFNLAKPIIKKDGDSLETFSFELGTTF